MKKMNSDLIMIGNLVVDVGIFYQLTKIAKAMEILTEPQKAATIEILWLINNKPTGMDNMIFKAGETKKAVLKINDKFGNPAKVDGLPKWGSSNESLLSIVVAEDGMSADVTSLGGMGLLELQVSADADMSDGVKDIFGKADVEVIAGDAEVLELSFQ
jgi:hypothetical protein